MVELKDSKLVEKMDEPKAGVMVGCMVFLTVDQLVALMDDKLVEQMAESMDF